MCQKYVKSKLTVRLIGEDSKSELLAFASAPSHAALDRLKIRQYLSLNSRHLLKVETDEVSRQNLGETGASGKPARWLGSVWFRSGGDEMRSLIFMISIDIAEGGGNIRGTGSTALNNWFVRRQLRGGGERRVVARHADEQDLKAFDNLVIYYLFAWRRSIPKHCSQFVLIQHISKMTRYDLRAQIIRQNLNGFI